MRRVKSICLFALVVIIFGCASGYKIINPETINYTSSNVVNDVRVDYKYNLLKKRYAKNEIKKGVRLVAVKITNNTDRDLKFGTDIKLSYQNGSEVYILENNQLFSLLKQQPASYLWYLFLTPLNLTTTTTSSSGIQNTSDPVPIGLGLGPALAGGNLIAASSANRNFKKEIQKYNLNDVIIKSGETQYGLVGIKSNYYDSITLKIQ